MAMLMRLGGAWKTISAGKIFASGAWRNLKAVKIYAGGAWRDVASFVQPITLAITPSPFAGRGPGPIVTSSSITATPTGGSAPFSYAWTVLSGAVTINSPTLASTTVNGNISGGNISATLQCVVTDSFGSTATQTVTGTLSYRAPIDTGGTQ